MRCAGFGFLVVLATGVPAAVGTASALEAPAVPLASLAAHATRAHNAGLVADAACAADTQWTANGRPICVAAGTQWRPCIASDGGGGAFIAWTDSRVGWRVALQHVLANGRTAVGWPDTGLVISAPAQYVHGPVVVADENGGAYVVWANGTNNQYEVLVQHVDGSSVVVPGWPALGLPVAAVESNQYRPRAATDAAGGVYVVWEDDRSGVDNPDLYIQRLQADGTPAVGWDPAGTPLCTSAGYQYRAAVCPDGSGGVIAAWVDGHQVSAVRMTSAGVPAPGWPENGVAVRLDTTSVWSAVVGSDLQGGCYVSWVGNWCVYVHRLDAAGEPAPGWPDGGRAAGVTGFLQDYQAISAGATGVYVSWWDEGFLRVTRLTSTGETPVPWPADGMVLTDGESATETAPVLLTDTGEDLYMVWSQRPYLNPSASGVVATRLTPGGATAPGWSPDPVMICGGGMEPVAVLDAAACTIAWTDGRNGSSDIYAGRLAVDGTVPALLALVDVSAEADRIRLRWYGGGAQVSVATLYRRTAISGWAALAELTADGTATFRYEDTAVESGGRYCYCLGGAASAEDRLTEETWVDVPARSALALGGARPNPTTGPLAVEFTLAGDDPAVLELLDVSGRRMLARSVGEFGTGRHVLTLAAPSQPRNGVYWMRLTQGGVTATSRVIVTR
jgi:hypothetical protein